MSNTLVLIGTLTAGLIATSGVDPVLSTANGPVLWHQRDHVPPQQISGGVAGSAVRLTFHKIIEVGDHAPGFDMAISIDGIGAQFPAEKTLEALPRIDSDGNVTFIGILGGFDQNVDRLLGRLLDGRADGALVRVSTPITHDDTVAARRRLLAFASLIDPILGDYWPSEVSCSSFSLDSCPPSPAP